MAKTGDLALPIGRRAVAALFIPGGLDKLMDFGRFAGSPARRGPPFPDVCAVAGIAGRALAMIAYVAMAPIGGFLLLHVADAGANSADAWRMGSRRRGATA